ncbi:MAG: type II toxin-antitoxin system RelE/ParE family toxin [Hyphomicrobium sp.]
MNRLPVVFYANSAGAEPVREWLKDLDRDDRREIGSDILAVQQGWPLGLPLCRSLGKGLWEVRSSLSGGRIARVIFAFDDGTIVLLNGFVKKTRKTPPTEIAIALKRLKEMTS